MNAKQLVTGAVATLLLSVASIQAETIGNPLVAGDGNIDTAQGAIFVELDGFTQPGLHVSSFGFFNNTGDTSLQVTPLIFHEVGGNFIISGVGNPVTDAGTGAQIFPFSLASGSAAVGPGYFFGYKNGTDANSGQTGVIEFSFSTPAVTSESFFGTGLSNNLSVGTNLGAGTFLGPDIMQPYRVYAVQATAVPEPSSCVLCGLGAIGLLLVARRRRRS